MLIAKNRISLAVNLNGEGLWNCHFVLPVAPPSSSILDRNRSGLNSAASLPTKIICIYIHTHIYITMYTQMSAFARSEIEFTIRCCVFNEQKWQILAPVFDLTTHRIRMVIHIPSSTNLDHQESKEKNPNPKTETNIETNEENHETERRRDET